MTSDLVGGGMADSRSRKTVHEVRARQHHQHVQAQRAREQQDRERFRPAHEEQRSQVDAHAANQHSARQKTPHDEVPLHEPDLYSAI